MEHGNQLSQGAVADAIHLNDQVEQLPGYVLHARYRLQPPKERSLVAWRAIPGLLTA